MGGGVELRSRLRLCGRSERVWVELESVGRVGKRVSSSSGRRADESSYAATRKIRDRKSQRRQSTEKHRWMARFMSLAHLSPLFQKKRNGTRSKRKCKCRVELSPGYSKHDQRAFAPVIECSRSDGS
jgi:hypothetical protein